MDSHINIIPLSETIIILFRIFISSENVYPCFKTGVEEGNFYAVLFSGKYTFPKICHKKGVAITKLKFPSFTLFFK